MDSITLAMDVWTKIGIPPKERATSQRLKLIIRIELDLSIAGEEDAIDTSVDYKNLAEDIENLAKTERQTIEKFAEDIAAMAMGKYHMQNITVTAAKKPKLRGVTSASVTIHRRNNISKQK